VGVRDESVLEDSDEDEEVENGNGNEGKGWIKKRVNRIRSAELAPKRVLKKIRSEPVVDSGAVGEGGGGHGGGGMGGNKWRDPAKVLGYFRASLATPIG
jgi:hypothetical protein